MGKTARSAVVSRAEDPSIPHDERADKAAGAGGARFYKLRDLHKVDVPIGPFMHGSDYAGPGNNSRVGPKAEPIATSDASSKRGAECRRRRAAA